MSDAVPTDAPIDLAALSPVLKSLLARAKAQGAESADAIVTHGRSLSVAVRGGELEDVDNSEGRDIGLRVMVGQRQACVSSSDLSDASMETLAKRAVAMARLAPEDPYCGLAPKSLWSQEAVELELFDSHLMSPETLKSRALEIEKATEAVPGVMQAEGASASWATSGVYFMTSDGFSRGWRSSRHGLSVSAIAERGGAMERDYDYDGTRWFEDLRDPGAIGRLAGERAVSRLGSKQLSSGSIPIIFDRRVSGALVGAFLGSINGLSIARGMSFLKDKMGETLFPSHISILDDPLIRRGYGSRPNDGEGVGVHKRALVENGVLKSWLLNTSAAKQLGLETTGHASRGIGSPPSVSSTNSYIPAGPLSPEQLIAETGHGLLITEMFGPSLNANTGDYSVGVAGFCIEKGQKTFPVSEVTIAGNLLEIFPTVTVANDLVFDGSTVAPTLRVEGLTLAGL